MFIEVTKATLRAHPKQALYTARQQGRGVLEPLYIQQHQHNNISVVQLKPTKKYLQRLLVPLAFATAKSSLYSVGSPTHPKMLAAVANRSADTESKVPSSSGMVKANDDGACLRLAHAQVEIKSRRCCAGRRGGARVSTVDCARSPYGDIQTTSTFICGLNGVGGGGGTLCLPSWSE